MSNQINIFAGVTVPTCFDSIIQYSFIFALYRKLKYVVDAYCILETSAIYMLLSHGTQPLLYVSYRASKQGQFFVKYLVGTPPPLSYSWTLFHSIDSDWPDKDVFELFHPNIHVST